MHHCPSADLRQGGGTQYQSQGRLARACFVRLNRLSSFIRTNWTKDALAHQSQLHLRAYFWSTSVGVQIPSIFSMQRKFSAQTYTVFFPPLQPNNLNVGNFTLGFIIQGKFTMSIFILGNDQGKVPWTVLDREMGIVWQERR